PLNCYDGIHPNTDLLRCKWKGYNPRGWTSDTDIGSNSCCFSDLPAHASMQYLDTGTCVDYSVVLTTLLRMSGYEDHEVYSTRSDCPGDSGHAFNLIKLPGDSKYTLIDNVGNCNGYRPGNTPGCNDCYYCQFEKCSNDNGKGTCPSKCDVFGCSGGSTSSFTLTNAVDPSQATVPSKPTLVTTSTTEEDIKVTRTVFEEVNQGQIVEVNITVENYREDPVNVVVKDSIAGAIAFTNLKKTEVPAGMTAPPMPYIEFSDGISSHDKKSFTYSILPEFVGQYVHPATEVNVDNSVIHLDTQTTKVNCISDGVCDVNSGENYITCPQDCWSGAEDGICNPVKDGQTDPDCIEGLDYDSTSTAYPIANFTYSPLEPKTNETVVFNASTSYDSDGSIVSFEWDFDEDGVIDEAGENATYSYSSSGTFTVNLTITDNDELTSSTIKQITVHQENQKQDLKQLILEMIIEYIQDPDDTLKQQILQKIIQYMSL
ncbi:MAG: PKD domain-containing protein, partial [Archaeoglobaceae archaeon]